MLPPPPKATITFETPAINGNTASSRLAEVRFLVASPSPVARVELVHNGARIFSGSAEQPAAGPDEFHLAAAVKDIRLANGQNDFEVLAVNGGGESRELRTINYVAPPVEVLVERIQSQNIDHEAIQREGGVVEFPQPVADGSDVTLYGRVRWPNLAAKQAHQVTDLHVWANGFLQPAVTLATSTVDALESTWQTKIRLNKLLDNTIEVGIPGVPRELSQSSLFQVDCLDPDTHQRLHLLVVGVGETNSESLEGLALSAVAQKRTRRARMRDPRSNGSRRPPSSVPGCTA